MNTTTQIQIRIDTLTKRSVQLVLNELGLDLSTAIKILCKQIAATGTFPLELRDVNGFRPEQANVLRLAQRTARANRKSFQSTKALLREAMN
ncbi:MAG: type II toxin-antitoxin system RelB/DinJ family antitoxin [Patescibacteria group bacterium]|jgi:addiction module RelB/DinJ family antitoxin